VLLLMVAGLLTRVTVEAAYMKLNLEASLNKHVSWITRGSELGLRTAKSLSRKVGNRNRPSLW
jgi:hypothetical protein